MYQNVPVVVYEMNNGFVAGFLVVDRNLRSSEQVTWIVDQFAYVVVVLSRYVE